MKKPNFQEAKYQTTTLPLDIFGVVTLNPHRRHGKINAASSTPLT